MKYLTEKGNYTVADYITEALFTLMESIPFEEISVTMLCDKAGVSRASFYRNFENTYNVISRFLYNDMEVWWANYSLQSQEIIYRDFYTALFEHYKSSCSKFMLLKNNNLLYLIKDAIYASGGPKAEMQDLEAYSRAAFLGMLYAVIVEWIQRGMGDIPDIPSIKRAGGWSVH